jgi:Lipocalin-like domain
LPHYPSRFPEVVVRLLLLLAAVLVSAPACAGDAEKIVGTWKLVSVVYDDVNTHELTPVLGEHPRGYQIATPDGRWLALVTAENRPVPKTEAERARALQTMISYSGRYRVEDGKVITKVDVAWNESWVGGEQVRFIRFEGDDLLHIESPPMPHPNVNDKVVRVIVSWQRDGSAAAKAAR